VEEHVDAMTAADEIEFVALSPEAMEVIDELDA